MLRNFAFLAAFGLSFCTYSTFAADFTDAPLQNCSNLAKASQKQNTQILIIGIEGTLQYDAADANDLFDYSAQRKKGPVYEELPELRSFGGILTNGLLFPLLRDFGDRVDALSFDFNNLINGEQTIAVECAREWTRLPGHKVVIVGHSTGAQWALKLANTLYRNQIPVSALITIDALPVMNLFTGVFEIRRPSGVFRYFNFYQSEDRFHVYNGQSASDADVNIKLTDVAGHMTVTASPTIYRYIAGLLRSR